MPSRPSRPSSSRQASSRHSPAAHVLAALALLTVLAAMPSLAKPASESTSEPSSPFGTPHPDAPAELHQFGFLIGPWSCDLDWLQVDGSRAQGQGTWTGRWMMDGWAIQDDFRGGFYEGFHATTFRAWDRRAKGWRGYWLDGRSGAWSRPLVQEATDQGLRLRTSTPFQNAEGEIVEVELRYHFHKIAEKRFSWRQDSSLDGGTTWQEGTMRIECQRPETDGPLSSASAPASGSGPS